MSETCRPEMLVIDYQTYRMFCRFCNLLADGYVVSGAKDHGKEIGLITIYMNKCKELSDDCNN